MNRTTTMLALTLVLIATPALAGDDDCAVPMTDWQPREAVVKLAADQGWALRRIRIDDGCYELIGRDAEGRAIEVKLNPATLAVVEMEFGDDHGEGREPEDDTHDD
ncbi:PepSY domain-containing protein [Tabrizicola sp. J26]|uniref:PepSY domain-containing protein n=1 Tax=Alitabrizicola rongguiensis TaxID=2909234 RepID=UPI001F2A3276|nr:PepSY domain-containing protein [Tabrizicola rongguiensis]MCF1708898.1 PepSY domain-containing protein [Tabrizicola rongguiensis]